MWDFILKMLIIPKWIHIFNAIEVRLPKVAFGGLGLKERGNKVHMKEMLHNS